MLDFRPISFISGLLLAPLGLFMLIPALIDGSAGHPDWNVFILSSAFTTFFGVSLSVANRGIGEELNLRQAFLLTTVVWIILPGFAAIPFVFSEINLSYTDAFFESMSGLTTTGSTVITGLDHAPRGILMWRALLQWLGGVGIIVMALAVLPMLRIGGMQLFRMENSDNSDKILPRAAQVSGAVALLYLGLSTLCFIALIVAGLPVFEAAAHAMTTIATGGFSTSDSSIGGFNSGAVDVVITIFMILGSLPFLLFFQFIAGRPMALFRDSQVRAFIGLNIILISILATWLITHHQLSAPDAVRYASFNIVSIISGTGFTTTDYSQWGTFAVGIFFLIMFVGGCAGSTSCGLKIFRFQILYQTMLTQIRQLSRPHAVFKPTFNGRPISDGVMGSVLSFVFLFILSYIALTIALSLTGLDFMTAASGAGTAISNVGPGLGSTIGPSGTFQSLPDTAKWILSFGMLLGRLELFTVLVLFTPSFWRA